MFVPSTEVLGVGVGVGGVGVVTGATTGSTPTSVVAVEVVLARVGSASVAFTVAVLWRVPGSNPAVTATVAVTELPEGMEPRPHGPRTTAGRAAAPRRCRVVVFVRASKSLAPGINALLCSERNGPERNGPVYL
jgi:hypothetical protein